ncbi:MAG: carbohydrate binding family 9 domain-containing protein, partial [Flavitalea sp.]
MSQPVHAQKKNESYQLHIKRTMSPVYIDGETNDEGWKDAQFADNFNMMLPMDTSKARVKTAVRMTYDEENLYILAECFNLVPGSYVVESLRRDFSYVKNDNFLLFLDPFEDATNGFSFGANAAGAQWDCNIYEGFKYDLNWDQKWISVVRNTKEKWVFEAAIPFKSIRYKRGSDRWGINFARLDLKATEKSSWTPIPRQFPTASLAYTGVLLWDAPPPSPR